MGNENEDLAPTGSSLPRVEAFHDVEEIQNSLQAKRNIMVVEDSATQAEMLDALLSGQGYSVTIARDGVEALQKLSESLPDLVISDIVMPRMSGFDLCQQMKNDKILNLIPVMLLTGLSDPQDIIRALECGADNFITKPFNERYLISRVQQLLASVVIRQGGRLQIGVELVFANQRHFITAERQQILDLLLSTYEAALVRNSELLQASEELQVMNEKLEDIVQLRTAELQDKIRVLEQTEQALRREKIFTTHIVNSSPILIVGVDRDGTTRYVNPAVEHVLGYKPEELIGRNMWALIYPGATNDGNIEKIKSGEYLENSEFQTRHKSGEARTIAWTSIPGVESEGGPALLGIGLDVTKLRQAEASRSEMQSQLQQAAKMATLGEMATGVAHEMNQPLNAIRISATMIEETISEEKPDLAFIGERSQKILEMVTRASKFITHMRIFGRKSGLQMELIDPHQPIRDALDFMAQKLKNHGIAVACEFVDLPKIYADPNSLEQVYINLIVNAMDAIESQGAANTEPRLKIRTDLELRGTYVAIHFSDNGPGMPEDVRKRIFEPFYTTKETGKGTGLGLSISYGIIDSHGGSIEVVSDPKGTMFHIALPLGERGAGGNQDQEVEHGKN